MTGVEDKDVSEKGGFEEVAKDIDGALVITMGDIDKSKEGVK